MIWARVIRSPGYKSWEWRWRRINLRFTRYALGENDRFGIALHLIWKGQP